MTDLPRELVDVLRVARDEVAACEHVAERALRGDRRAAARLALAADRLGRIAAIAARAPKLNLDRASTLPATAETMDVPTRERPGDALPSIH